MPTQMTEEETIIELATEYDELSLELIDFIVENSDYEYDGHDLPDVQVVDGWYLASMVNPTGAAQCEMMEIFSTKECPHVGNYLAAYYYNVIVFNEDWDWTEKGFKSVLLHELVHFLQEIRGEGFDAATQDHCDLLALEQPAYHIQSKWNVQNELEFPMPWLELMMWEGRCNGGPYYDH